MNFGIREFGRTILTVTGIILLLLFGVRAASQASSLEPVRGKPALQPLNPYLSAATLNYPDSPNVAYFSGLSMVTPAKSEAAKPASTKLTTKKVAALPKKAVDSAAVQLTRADANDQKHVQQHGGERTNSGTKSDQMVAKDNTADRSQESDMQAL